MWNKSRLNVQKMVRTAKGDEIIPKIKRTQVGFFALLIIMIVVIAGGVLSGCKSENIGIIGGADGPTAIFVTEDSPAKKLYQYKNTDVGNNSKVGAIINLLPFSELTRDKIELHTDSEPYGITINFYMNKDITQIEDDHFLTLNKYAAIMLSLIDNAEYVKMMVKDNNGDSKYGTKATRETLRDYFLYTLDLNNVTETEDRFSEFYDEMISFSFSKYINDKITELIPNDRQIAVNSGQKFSFTYRDNIKTENFNLESIAKEHGVNINNYYGNKIDVYIYAVETSDLSSQQYTSSPYIFVFCAEELLGYKDLKSIEVEQEIKPYLIKLTEQSSNDQADKGTKNINGAVTMSILVNRALLILN